MITTTRNVQMVDPGTKPPASESGTVESLYGAGLSIAPTTEFRPDDVLSVKIDSAD